MDNRLPLNTTTRPLPQRAVSGSSLYFPRPQTRPSLPSRLSSVRSVSQPGSIVDLTSDGSPTFARNIAAYAENHGGNVVASPGVIDVDDDDELEERPAKRTKIGGDDFRAEEGEIMEHAKDAAQLVVKGEELPSLPKAAPPNARSVLARRRRIGTDAAVRKANGIKPPAMAVKLPAPKNAADFSPWTGHHPEDVLNEAVVKAGYCDKGPGASQTDCNSAKASIWPNLTSKNNTGLQMLSYLFTQVMDKRQALGKCIAPSIFKPPPRVTVTDTKREAWLRDLANPDVPLRKMSRTIPHGIRGKLLMDQCLGKEVPLQRAVWLAKCVGANELRAFRRKGVSGVAAASGECKWVREWTLNVEQFLEAVVASCGEQDWQLRMNYAVKLATAFYTEKLLDADHYLDWIVACFEEASIERLPIWIVMVQFYWRDIVRFIKRGRRLAEGILKRLIDLRESSTGVNEMLKVRLQKLVAVLAITSRGCLVLPRTWKRYEALLTPEETLHAGGQNESTAQNLAKRNKRIAGLLSVTPDSMCDPLLQLYMELDIPGLHLDVEQLTNRCLSTVHNTPSLVAALLDWACSPYRQGLDRVYLAAGIIGRLHGQGQDTDVAVLNYLQSVDGNGQRKTNNLYKVVAELVRANAFAAGKYLQWLISSGALYCDSANAALGLLTALPASSLPVQIANTRRTLLTRIEGAMEAQNAAKQLTVLFDAAIYGDDTARNGLGNQLERSSIATQTAVSDHVRTYMRTLPEDSVFSLDQYLAIRTTLESVGDLAALPDLIRLSMDTDDPHLLATATDTLTAHGSSFAALDSLKPLADSLIERYNALRAQQPLERTFIRALMRLVSLLKDRPAILNLLTDDLAICEQQNSEVVCSPASDSLIGMHASSLDSDEDIDAVFASGNTMDEQLLGRVFTRVMQRASKPSLSPQGAISKLDSWLNQLRLLGGTTFKQLAVGHVRSTFSSAGMGPVSLAALIALAASDCMSLAELTSCAKEAGLPHAASLAVHVLLSATCEDAALSMMERYRYRAMQHSYLQREAEPTVSLIVQACGDAHFNLADEAVIRAMVDFATRTPDAILTAFEKAKASQTIPARAAEISKVVLERGFPVGHDGELDIRATIALADPLSVRFCVGALRYFSNITEAEVAGVSQTVLKEAVQSDNSVWPQLLDSVSSGTKKMLHAWAQHRLLKGETDGPKCDSTRYLDVLDLTAASVREEDDTAATATLNDRLSEVDKQLSEPEYSTSCTNGKIIDTLRTLLHICVLHVPAPTTESEMNYQARCSLLTTLCSLLVNNALQAQQDTLEYLLDVASALADSIPEEALVHLSRTLKSPHPRVKAVLGTNTKNTEAWLALASQVEPPGTAQQRALAKHPSQQGQPSSRQGGQPLPQQQQQRHLWPLGGMQNRGAPVEMKVTPFPLRQWEVMPDSTPVMGENDTSLSLGLFGARKA